MIDLKQREIWFVTGSQHLYGPEGIEQVSNHSRPMAAFLDSELPVSVVFKPVVTDPQSISSVCAAANADPKCIGLITWMHTFSPAKMWIQGLTHLSKPFLHLHTQFNREIPWAQIDMDFMNMNQSAHGDREFGFMATRLRLQRKVVVGHWQDPEVIARIDAWVRAAAAWDDWQGMKIARFGDNMRDVAVTEGDKVEAQTRFGYDVYGYGVGDLVQAIRGVSDAEAEALIASYEKEYELITALQTGQKRRPDLVEAARIEAGLRHFLEAGGFRAFTTTFEDLHGLAQLPGLAVQRLMAEGIGFAAEGDWKTAALVRAMKVMDRGLPGGTSFMEDYTYHFGASGDLVLGAHMLEVCPAIAAEKPKLEIHPLSIGGKADPVRLVFESKPGAAINVSIVDLGDRFRMVLNEVEVLAPKEAMPRLPVARALWAPRPNLKTAAAAWILAGGAHHTGFSLALTREPIEDFAKMAGIELVEINADTKINEFEKELRWNEAYYA